MNMLNKLMLNSLMFFMYILLLVIAIVTVSATQVGFDLHRGMRDTYCSDHTATVAAMTSFITCGVRCLTLSGCLGLFYGTATNMCTLVTVISIPQSGCVQETGTDYYVRQVPQMFDGYVYTASDEARLATEDEYSVCTSYPYHVFHADISSTRSHGCDEAFSCCKTKGCYPAAIHDYVGTWSRTVSGRECQHWAQQSPHQQNYYLGNFPPGETYVTAMNYCRDPDYDGYWGYLSCYTTDPGVRWEKCEIPRC